MTLRRICNLDVYPISIDFSALEKKLEPLYHLQNEVQELTIMLRNLNATLADFPELMERIEWIKTDQEDVLKRIRGLVKKKPKKRKKAK